MKKTLEVCCGSYDDALAAYKGGADRIELNTSLALGGISPSLASVIYTVKNIEIPVICMVRPRAAGFSYNSQEAMVMFEDARLFLDNGAKGIAFGFLNDDHTINRAWTGEMVALIHSYPGNREAVFHRAIDCVDNYEEGVKELIDLGVDRILTSGGEKNAYEGREAIANIQKKYSGQIEILAGCGVNAGNVKDIIQSTGIHQVHSSAKSWVNDLTTQGNHVSYAYHNEYDYDVVSVDKVRELRSILDSIED